MKCFDEVRVKSDKYESYEIFKGDLVTILEAEIRFNTFFVMKTDPNTGEDIGDAAVYVGDLEECEEGYIAELTDEQLLNCLPNKDPSWWCKVEDGYIWNLKGEKKNKIAYDYES